MSRNHHLQLNDILEIYQKDKLLYMNDERAIVLPASAFGTLQRDLIENIGIDRMKSFFFKHGWNLGENDAKQIISNNSMSIEEKTLYGPIFHGAQGHLKPSITEHHLEIVNGKVTKFLYKGIWEKSSEAEQHVQNLGLAARPVCYTQTGYASGYISYLLGERVLFKELQCEGTGAPHCVWEGRLLADWKDEEDEQLFYYRELPILKELEHTNEQLMHEKNLLSMVTKIHTELTEEIIKGNGLDSILEMVNKQIGRPVVVEDIHHQVISIAGITPDVYEPMKNEFKDYLTKHHCLNKTTVATNKNAVRLVTPIYLQEKIVAYCSFLYDNGYFQSSEIDSMIIGRVAAACSLILLNEKTKLGSMERMKEQFLEEIFSGKYESQQQILNKAGFLELDISSEYYVVWLQSSVHENKEENELIFYRNLYETVITFFNEKGINILTGQRSGSILMLLPETHLHKGKIEIVIHSLLAYLKKKLKSMLFFIGISSKNLYIVEAPNALKEAQIAIRLSTKEEPVTLFDDLGIIGVLINDKNEKAIRKIASANLGRLYENLDQHKMELLDTLYHFLTNGGNLEQTADNLALSISGLRYRINKITDILGIDIRDPDIQFQLLLSLKAIKIIDNF